MKITGYASELRFEAGGSLDFHISSSLPKYRARLVRLIHGDRNMDGPGFKFTPCASNIDDAYDNGALQPVRKGSYAYVERHVGLSALDALTLAVWFWPTMTTGKRQVLIGLGGSALTVEVAEDGYVEVHGEGELKVRSQFALRNRAWCFLALRVDAEGRVILDCRPSDYRHCAVVETCSRGERPLRLPRGTVDVAFAASLASGVATHHFNGKIENPCAFDLALSDASIDVLSAGTDRLKLGGMISNWDFSQAMSSATIIDIASGCDGILVNQPTRAMMGHNWSGRSHDFREVPEEYGAIHFHDDDLGDCGWPVSLTLNVPSDQRSGIYAIHLENDEGEDFLPFAITPCANSKRSPIAFVIPTLTYLAYGNEAIANRPDIKAMMKAAGINQSAPYPAQQEDKYIVEQGLLSCYDIHSDGSGVCHSSKRRPLLNWRPTYLMPLHGLSVKPGGAAHLLAADLYITDWLEAHGYSFDVLTDEDLDENPELLCHYAVVINGSHPEYYTERMMDGTMSYLKNGGHLMYLGGNGYFWVTSLTSDRVSIETRRARTVRPWTSFAAEERHASTAELGGAWKYRARPAQAMVGVGTTAVGFTSGQPYAITSEGRDASLSWVFDGIDGELIGDFPNLLYGTGAAGWEVDRADPNWGTPPEAVILATARIEDDSYQQVVDELESAGGHTGGTQNPNVRADMTLTPFPNGGAVFSVGSCMWAGSLSYNNYDNSVSQVTRNILDKFLS